jgi:FHS family L-fucose permease-like MFS transporter
MTICYLLTITGPDPIAPYSLIAAGGFLSVLFPTVFGLAIEDLNDFTEHGSALLNIMIVGGAVFPPMQGMIADEWGINLSYLVPALCIVVVTSYGGFSSFRKTGESQLASRAAPIS